MKHLIEMTYSMVKTDVWGVTIWSTDSVGEHVHVYAGTTARWVVNCGRRLSLGGIGMVLGKL